MTKANALQHKTEWTAALRDARVVRFKDIDGEVISLTSYPTIAARDAALEAMRLSGVNAEVVTVGA
jgi:hypothetical protein